MESRASMSCVGRGAGERIWRGDLYVRGNRNDMMVPCVAIQCSLADKPPLRDASGWPSQLQCDASKLKSSTQVLNQLTEPISQWYVRFAPVDENGTEKEDAKLVQLVKVMVDKKLAFEINCDKPGGIPGTLYLWGMQIEHHEHSLLGVFQPHTPALDLSHAMKRLALRTEEERIAESRVKGA